MIAKLTALTEQTAYGHGVADALKPVAVFTKPDGTTETLSLDAVPFDFEIGDIANLEYAGTHYVAHRADENERARYFRLSRYYKLTDNETRDLPW